MADGQVQGSRLEITVWSELPSSEMKSFSLVLSNRSLMETTCVFFRFLVAGVKKII